MAQKQIAPTTQIIKIPIKAESMASPLKRSCRRSWLPRFHLAASDRANLSGPIGGRGYKVRVIAAGLN
jgi:hypothetical protein